jgi:hypothetical protein
MHLQYYALRVELATMQGPAEQGGREEGYKCKT